MADDYYRFLDTAHMLRGENMQRTYRLGDKVRVAVVFSRRNSRAM